MGFAESFVLSSELSFPLPLLDYSSSTAPLRLSQTRKTRPFIDRPSPRRHHGRVTSPSTFPEIFLENSRRFFIIRKFWAKVELKAKIVLYWLYPEANKHETRDSVTLRLTRDDRP